MEFSKFYRFILPRQLFGYEQVVKRIANILCCERQNNRVPGERIEKYRKIEVGEDNGDFEVQLSIRGIGNAHGYYNYLSVRTVQLL